MTAADALLIDSNRSIHLRDVGAPGSRAVVALDAQGVEHLILAQVDRINDDSTRVDNTGCTAVAQRTRRPNPDPT